MSEYYLRVEFQARGAPHIHCLLWLDEEHRNPETNEARRRPLKTMFSTEYDTVEQQRVIKNIENCAENLISASVSDVKCKHCQQNQIKHCKVCDVIKKRALTFNTHICGFSCHKRIKNIDNKIYRRTWNS